LPIESKVVLRRSIGVFLMVVSIWLASCQALMHQFSGGEATAGQALGRIQAQGGGEEAGS